MLNETPKAKTAKTKLAPKQLKNNLLPVIVSLFFLVIIFVAVMPQIFAAQRKPIPEQLVHASCTQAYRKDKILTIVRSNVQLYAEVADTPMTQQKGLSGRECIGDKQAMLFVFETDGNHAFWMKDMKFSLDMLWLDAGGRVVYIKDNATPESYPQTYSSDKPARYVLEIQSGGARKLGIVVGDVVSL